MPFDAGEAAITGVAVSEELFGTGKGSFNRFLSPFINAFTPISQAITVRALAGIGPDMTGEGFLSLWIGGAGGQKRAFSANGRIGFIVPVALPVSCGIAQRLTFRAVIGIGFSIIDIVSRLRIRPLRPEGRR